MLPQGIDSGLIGRFGNLDNSLGGNSSCYSLMAAWDHENSTAMTTTSPISTPPACPASLPLEWMTSTFTLLRRARSAFP